MEDSSILSSHILVIDDEDSLRLTFEMFLQRAGYANVTGVSTFEKALEVLRTGTVDLVISDIVLEGSSGIEILRTIKNECWSCPVIMVTGYPNIETAAEAVRLGAFDYLPKPVKKDALLAVVRKGLEHYHSRKEQEKKEQEFRQATIYQEHILRSIREIIISFDEQLKVVEMNDMATEWSRAFLPRLKPGVYLADLTDSAIANTLFNDIEQVRKSKQDIPEHRIEWQRNNGTHGVLSVMASPLNDTQGNFLGAVLSARDITCLEDIDNRKIYDRFHGIVGKSMVMQHLYALIENVGPVDTTVLITGDSGTGKELVAEALHRCSSRRNRPLTKVDCASIPEELLESELFGHKKGAFTGAARDRLGRILQADGGTLFLDEIGDISYRMQLRLLRFLQERVFYPVGHDQPIQVDVRVIAATNADLAQKVKDGHFREDLFYRLRVVDISLPPLSRRADDIPLLIEHFMANLEKQLKKNIHKVSANAMRTLTRYHWPGNVRELEHVIERAYVLCTDNEIDLDDLPHEIVSASAVDRLYQQPEKIMQPAISDDHAMSEEESILYALRRAGGNKAKAARILGVDRSTIYRKISAYDIDVSSEFPEMPKTASPVES